MPQNTCTDTDTVLRPPRDAVPRPRRFAKQPWGNAKVAGHRAVNHHAPHTHNAETKEYEFHERVQLLFFSSGRGMVLLSLTSKPPSAPMIEGRLGRSFFTARRGRMGRT